jgi:hypothetical protein
MPISRRSRPHARVLASALALLLAAACGGEGGAELDVSPDDVDASSSMTPTEGEAAAFSPPGDGVLTPAQVEAYLKTTLLQFDLVRSEAQGIHDRVRRIEERGERGGVVAGLRNAADGVALMAGIGDVVGGSYVRSARSLGYNPAEMEWVQERMGELSGYLMMRPIWEASVSQARTMREQASAYRGQEGFDEAQIRELIRSAEEMEESARKEMEPDGAVTANLAILRQARPQVSDHMWASVALVGGAGGLMALSGLSNPQDTTVQRQLEEWRRVYTDALANRVTPGMEPDVPWGQARVLPGTATP